MGPPTQEEFVQEWERRFHSGEVGELGGLEYNEALLSFISDTDSGLWLDMTVSDWLDTYLKADRQNCCG